MPTSREHHIGVHRSVIALFALLLALGLSVGLASPSHAASPRLQEGSIGADVTTLQHLLTAHGRSTAADGRFGSGTEAAVSAFQSANGLEVDGIAGPATFGALFVSLRQGDDGPAVQGLQVQLNKNGSALVTDGVFGSATNAAVRSFQSAHGLTVDGISSPATWEALLGTVGAVGSGSVPGTTYDSLSEEQKANARTIINVGKAGAIPQQGWVIALATAMQESTLINVNYGDRDSLGLFQQRTSQGWCTVAQCVDPVLAATAFYGIASHTSNPGLVDISGWQSMPVTQAAQAVQRSGFPDAYAKWESLARDIVAHESGAPAIA